MNRDTSIGPATTAVNEGSKVSTRTSITVAHDGTRVHRAADVVAGGDQRVARRARRARWRVRADRRAARARTHPRPARRGGAEARRAAVDPWPHRPRGRDLDG